MDEILDYVSERLSQFTWLIRPFLGLVAILSVVGTFSLVLSTYIYYTYRPVSMIREPVYFDFSQTPPVARVTLSAAEKQWRYLKRTDITQDAADMGPSYLSTGSIYSFHLECQLAKSDRNRGMLVGVLVSACRHSPLYCISLPPSLIPDLAKFMVTFTTFDATSEAVSLSARPLVLPWEHPSVTFLSSVSTWPLTPLGFHPSASVTVELMNNYREPRYRGMLDMVDMVALSPCRNPSHPCPPLTFPHQPPDRLRGIGPQHRGRRRGGGVLQYHSRDVRTDVRVVPLPCRGNPAGCVAAGGGAAGWAGCVWSSVLHDWGGHRPG